MSEIILGNCRSDNECKNVAGRPFCQASTGTCVQCKEENECKAIYGGLDAKEQKNVCVEGTCEVCKENSDCKKLFPGDLTKQACFRQSCHQCSPDTQETDCLVAGFKTCKNGMCKSVDGKFPDTKPDGTKVAFRQPWTKDFFQSRVLEPQQKTGNAIQAVSTDGASVAKVFSDARRDYIELLNAVTLSLDGMAGLNQANNQAFRDGAYQNEVWRHEQATDWLSFYFDYIQTLVAAKEDYDHRAQLDKKKQLLNRIDNFKIKEQKKNTDHLQSHIKAMNGRKVRYNAVLDMRLGNDKTVDKVMAMRDKVDKYLENVDDFKSSLIGLDDGPWENACRIFRAIFNPDLVLESPIVPPVNLKEMRDVWKETKTFSEAILEHHTKCETAMNEKAKEVNKKYEEYFMKEEYEKLKEELATLEGQVGIGRSAGILRGGDPLQESSLSKQAASTRNEDEYTINDSRLDIAIANNKRLITALIGKPEGDGTNNLKKVLTDFTTKLTKKFKKIDAWASGVNTWAGTVKAHVHPVSTILAGAAPAPAGVIAGTGQGQAAPSPAIGVLSPLQPATRALEPTINNTHLGNLTGPLGDGSPITAEDTTVTLNWLNNILPTLNLTKEEEEMLEVLGSEPKLIIELLTRARQEGLNIEGDISSSFRSYSAISILEMNNYDILLKSRCLIQVVNIFFIIVHFRR